MRCGRLIEGVGKAPPGILHPYSRAKVYWDMLTMMMLFYAALATPVKLTFDFEAVNGCRTTFTGQEWHFYANVLVDFIFMLDILVVFRTAFFHPETRILVSDTKQIAARYLRSFFLLDLMSAIPLDLILLPYCESQVSADALPSPWMNSEGPDRAFVGPTG